MVFLFASCFIGQSFVFVKFAFRFYWKRKKNKQFTVFRFSGGWISMKWRHRTLQSFLLSVSFWIIITQLFWLYNFILRKLKYLMLNVDINNEWAERKKKYYVDYNIRRPCGLLYGMAHVYNKHCTCLCT